MPFLSFHICFMDLMADSSVILLSHHHTHICSGVCDTRANVGMGLTVIVYAYNFGESFIPWFIGYNGLECDRQSLEWGDLLTLYWG